MERHPDTPDRPAPTVTRYLPVTHCRAGVRYQEALLSNAKLLEAYWHAWDPACSLRFVTCWADGTLSVGYEAAAGDPDTAEQVLRFLATALGTIQPWLGVGEITDTEPWPAIDPGHTTFGAEQADVSRIFATHSLTWREHAGHQGVWHVVVDLLAPADPTTATRTPLGAADTRPDDGAFHTVGEGVADGALARVTLHGTGRDGPTLAALLMADGTHDARLMASPADAPTLDLGTPLPGNLLAHLLATPARVGGLLPEHRPTPSEDLLERMEDTPSPHTLLVGQTGQGKSTAAAAIGVRALRAGRSVIAVDVHDGDLLRRLYQAACSLGRPALYIDCTPRDDTSPVPTLRMADLPPGMRVHQHVQNQVSLLFDDVWSDMPKSFSGPVGRHIAAVGIELAVRDPERTFGLSQLGRLLDPSQADFRREVLSRVNDDELTRAVVRQILPMTREDSTDNGYAWIVSKFTPLATGAVRDILEGTTHAVPVEQALARGYSLFLHVPTGHLGDEPTRTIAAAFLHRIRDSIRLAPLPNDLALLLDELQTYASTLVATLFAESRKFRMRLVAAHQNFAQISAPIRETLLSNAGSIGCFRLGPADAALMDELFPTVPRRTLQTLPRHTLALTTFDADTVAAGPAPLPEPTDTIPGWAQQLHDFWGGPEPAPTPSRLPAEEAPSEAEGTTDPDGSLRDLLRARRST